MKLTIQRKDVATLGCVFLLVLVLGLWFVHGWLEVSWKGWADFRLKSLARAVELFRDDQDRYPDSLSELPSNRFWSEDMKKAIAELLRDRSHGIFPETVTYSAVSNGFTIIISGPELPPAGWFGKQRMVQRTYRAGEALESFEKDVKPK